MTAIRMFRDFTVWALIGATIMLSGCSAMNGGLKSRCDDAATVYAPVQVGIEAAVTQPNIGEIAKQKLKAIDRAAVQAIAACDVAASAQNAANVRYWTDVLATQTALGLEETK